MSAIIEVGGYERTATADYRSVSESSQTGSSPATPFFKPLPIRTGLAGYNIKALGHDDGQRTLRESYKLEKE